MNDISEIREYEERKRAAVMKIVDECLRDLTTKLDAIFASSAQETSPAPVEGVVPGSNLERQIQLARQTIERWPDDVRRAMGIVAQETSPARCDCKDYPGADEFCTAHTPSKTAQCKSEYPGIFGAMPCQFADGHDGPCGPV